MYHDLFADGIRSGNGIESGRPTQSQFRRQLLELRKKFRVISVEEAVAEIKSTGKLACPSASISFDDGCASVYNLAFPVLKELEMTATVFLPTDWINRRMIPWWITLRNLLAGWNPERVELSEIMAALGPQPEIIPPEVGNSQSLKRRLGVLLDDYLRAKSGPEIAEILKRIQNTAGVTLPERLDGDDPMNWEQIKEMAGAGIHFGAHTVTHINLKYADKITAEKEISESRNEIEKHLARKVRGFAYPYGMDVQSYEKLVDYLRAEDFEYACTAAYGRNEAHDNLYLLRRITLPSTMSPALLGRILILDYYQG